MIRSKAMEIQRNEFFINSVNKLNIDIIDSGYVIGDNTWRNNSVVPPYSRVYFFEEGEAVIKSDTETLIMKPGNVYLIPTGLRISYSCDSYYKKLFFHINMNNLDGYDILADLKTFISLPMSKEEISKLISCHKSSESKDVLYIKKAVYTVISDMLYSRNMNMFFRDKYYETTERAIQFIKSHLSYRWSSVKLIAEHLYVSENTLMNHFKEDMSISIKTYIDDQIFFSVEKALLKTEWSISKISETFGFCDQFYFSKKFKQRYGCSPTQYKKNQKGIL